MMSAAGRFEKSGRFPSVINLRIGHPHPDLLMPKDDFFESVKAAVSCRTPKEMFDYNGEVGDVQCLPALARFLTEEGKLAKPVESDTLYLCAGVSHCLQVACLTYTKPGEIILTEDPTYFLASRIFAENGLKAVGVPLDEHGLDVDRIEEILKGMGPDERVGAVYTIPMYQNPTGICLSHERKARLIDLAYRYNFRIFSDEVYWLLGFEGKKEPVYQSMSDMPGADGIVVSMSSLSKIIGPGFRFGWIRASREDIQKAQDAGYYLFGGDATHITSVLLTHALESGMISNWLTHVREKLSRQCKMLCDELRKEPELLEFNEPTGGYFIWVKPKMSIDCTELLKTSESRYGFTCLPGASCSPDSEKSAVKDRLRYCFAHVRPDVLLEGARRAVNCLADQESNIKLNIN